MKTPALLVSLAGLLLCSACHVSLGSHSIVVDGVKLKKKHEEALSVESWPATGLSVRSAVGDIRIEPSRNGETLIRVMVYERVEGDGYATLEDGVLKARSRTGEPTAIGDVLVMTDDLPSLRVETGMGDVKLSDVNVQGSLELDTGMGDVTIVRAGAPGSIRASTGMGDVEIDHTSCQELVGTSGMGDVELDHVLAESGRCSSGMGDVELQDCSFVRLKASTGMGDVDCLRTSYEEGELDSGLGSVTRRD